MIFVLVDRMRLNLRHHNLRVYLFAGLISCYNPSMTIRAVIATASRLHSRQTATGDNDS
jgi:hypothetical protein